MPVLVCALMTSKRGLLSPWQQPRLNTSYLITIVKWGRLYIKGRGEGKSALWEDCPAFII